MLAWLEAPGVQAERDSRMSPRPGTRPRRSDCRAMADWSWDEVRATPRHRPEWECTGPQSRGAGGLEVARGDAVRSVGGRQRGLDRQGSAACPPTDTAAGVGGEVPKRPGAPKGAPFASDNVCYVPHRMGQGAPTRKRSSTLRSIAPAPLLSIVAATPNRTGLASPTRSRPLAGTGPCASGSLETCASRSLERSRADTAPQATRRNSGSTRAGRGPAPRESQASPRLRSPPVPGHGPAEPSPRWQLRRRRWLHPGARSARQRSVR